jgi:hypothetical protein
MIKYICFVVACSFAMGTNLLAQEQRSSSGIAPRGEKAWHMSDEDRIVARTSIKPAAGSRAAKSSATEGFSEMLDGKTRPELLLPYELFDSLLEGLSEKETHRVNARRILDPQLRAFGFHPDVFWSTLSTVADRYLKTRAENWRLHRQSTVFTTAAGIKTWLPINQADCALRIAALNEAREKLGGTEAFDHFLYSAVAPNVSYAETGNESDRAAQLRYMAGGCK